MDAVARALADPASRGMYLVFCLLLLVAPMLALALWYRARVTRTAGGRALMGEQARLRGYSNGGLPEVIRLVRDIAAGRYGAEVRGLQNTTYALVAIWVIANTVAFGILIWADEVNRP